MTSTLNIQLLVSSGVLTVLGASTEPHIDLTMDVACCAAGVFGGTTMQLLTYIERKPHLTIMLGNLLASAALGWGVYAYTEPTPNLVRGTIILALAAGASGAWGFRAMVKKFAPEWLETEPQGDNRGDS
jgi:hypothetical protein